MHACFGSIGSEGNVNPTCINKMDAVMKTNGSRKEGLHIVYFGILSASKISAHHLCLILCTTKVYLKF